MSGALVLRAADGTPLAAHRFAPDGAPRGAVLLAGALGVPARAYTPFAQWLAAQGWTVLSFDPRGIGASRAPAHTRSLRGLDADLLTWARQDFAAAVHHLADDAGAPVRLIGHSLGLHHAAMGTADVQARIALAVGVASGAGPWWQWAAPARRRAPLLFHLVGPPLTALLGWFPGRRLGMVADLPGPAMRQWSRWCRHPRFAWGADPKLVAASLANARFPIRAVSFTDDEAMSEGNTRTLLAALPNAPSTLHRIAPQDVGLQRIGHLGAFRPASSALWPRLAELLD